MVGAGLLFDTCQVDLNLTYFILFIQIIIYYLTKKNWDLYQNIHEIIILVPALLGLNLEITLASRLSTQVTYLITINHLIFSVQLIIY